MGWDTWHYQQYPSPGKGRAEPAPPARRRGAPPEPRPGHLGSFRQLRVSHTGSGSTRTSGPLPYSKSQELPWPVYPWLEFSGI